MVQNKKLLIVVVILAASLTPRFLLTGVRTVFEKRPVESLPARFGEWEAVEVFVCPECHKELKQAVASRSSPANPDMKINYMQNELENNACPIHHLAVTPTKDVPVSFLVQAVLPARTEFLKKEYRNGPVNDPSSRRVTVTVVISGADQRGIHRPERCLQGQGWQIISRDRLLLPLSTGNVKNLQVTRLVTRNVWLTPKQEKKEVREVVFYWFMGHNRLTGNNLKRMAYASWDRMFRGLNYRWGYVLVISPLQNSVEESTGQLSRFVSELLPLIRKEV